MRDMQRSLQLIEAAFRSPPAEPIPISPAERRGYENASRKRDELLAYVDKLTFEPPRLTYDILQKTACASYNQFWLDIV